MEQSFPKRRHKIQTPGKSPITNTTPDHPEFAALVTVSHSFHRIVKTFLVTIPSPKPLFLESDDSMEIL
jgi:hypothetical protein